MKIIDEKWEESSFMKKNSLILFIFYLYEKEKVSIEFIIKIVELYSFKDFSEDYEIIKNDWCLIQNKIKD
jgi:DNA mismatch repair protein MutH